MKTLKTTARIRAIALVLMGLVPAAGQACVLWQDESGILHGDCKLADILGNYELNYDILVLNRPRLALPNIKVKKFKYALYGQSGEVAVEAENLGARCGERSAWFRGSVPVIAPGYQAS